MKRTAPKGPHSCPPCPSSFDPVNIAGPWPDLSEWPDIEAEPWEPIAESWPELAPMEWATLPDTWPDIPTNWAPLDPWPVIS